MRIIEVKIIPNARKNTVEEDGSRYKVHVTAPAVDGKANKALIEVLAEFFKIKKTNISIIKGETSRIKFIRVEDE